jgi:RNA polymerase sigma-70 factor (ECF subfamily)
VTDEKLLIEGARRGEIDAFRRLVERSKITTYRLAYDLSGNRHDAEDICQEAYIRALKGLQRFRGDAKWSSWMHRITVNVFLDHRRANRKEFVEFNDELETPETVDAKHTTHPHPDPLTLTEAGDIQRQIDRALDSLPPRERSVFVLRHYQDLKLSDIAKAMDIAEGTVKVHLHRAVRRLRKELQALGNDLGMEGLQ